MTARPHPRTWVLLAVSVGVFCIQLDAFALNLALPRIGTDLGVRGDGAQWTVSAYLLSTGTLMLGAGRLGDLLGRRRLLVWGLSLFGAASLVCALAGDLPVLVAARVVQGAGAAMTMPVGLSLLTNVYPEHLRGRASGLAFGIGGVATACGPFVGGVLTEAVSWRAVFWLNVPLAALGALCASRTAESLDTTAPRRIDWSGLVTVTGALAAFAVLLDRVQRGVAHGELVLPTLLCATLLGAFVRVERRAPHPLVGFALFRNGPYVALTLTGAVVNAATVMFLFTVPLSLQGSWGLSAAAAGTAFLPSALAMAVAGPLAGRVTTRGAAPAMATCLGGGALGLLGLVLAPDLPAYLVAATFCGVAFGLANTLTLIATQGIVRPERAGEASGVTKTVITVAAGLGVALAGSVTGHDVPAAEAAAHTALSAAAAGCAAACAVLLWWMSAVRTRARRAGARDAEEGPHRRTGSVPT
ncbi:MFS transporter [Streptomyces somaliensis DSM 40738]|uniref:MFS transporter n=1 Tax=Streptomyces somaliensis (strain ATCC 33201 / DSM 40738 / JCM 12659 / KCTC 9044 / NCTC 11332 / NRRL B-12077 / IP 733) TaxID=1134445 RepID=A0AA44IBY7_STRE0|nr:MFS transporter [Streptomyces somaliensis]MCQ0023685.1 MFS transporter [Streptomyces somaliensis DSM 40738]NKY13119.1 MFS transporter [Streptomyces somaliensis DSM 40738]